MQNGADACVTVLGERDQGKVKQARELLAPVSGWFTEGFDTRDLKEGEGSAGGVGVMTVC